MAADFEFKLPDLGEGIQEAQVLAWKVQPGDPVEAFQPLCEVESAKAAVELTSPVAGTVGEIRRTPGETAKLGDVLVVIQTEPSAEWVGIVGSKPPVRAAPFVRKLARDLGVKLEEVQATGPHGRVRVADIEAASEARGRPDGESIPLQGMRKQIADHLVEAVRHAPQVTSMDLVDVTELVRAREIWSVEGRKLTYLPFIVKAAVEALKAVPEANAVVGESRQAIVLKREYNIGIATAIPGGLVVPVVKGVDRLSMLELAREIGRLVTAARERRSTPTDLAGSTFSITNFGGLPGSPLFATPILNYPEVAILGIGRIEPQPRVVDGQIVARECMGVSFTFDHRAMDGAGAGQFISVIKRFLGQPLELLLRLR